MPEMTIDELAVIMQDQFHNIQDDLSAIKSDILVIKEDIVVLKEDVGVLKEDVGNLKSDMALVKFEISELKTGLSDLRNEHGEKLDNLLDMVQGLAKNSRDHSDELVLNQFAHDRYNRNFFEIKTQLNIKNIDAVKPLD